MWLYVCITCPAWQMTAALLPNSKPAQSVSRKQHGTLNKVAAHVPWTLYATKSPWHCMRKIRVHPFCWKTIAMNAVNLVQHFVPNRASCAAPCQARQKKDWQRSRGKRVITISACTVFFKTIFAFKAMYELQKVKCVIVWPLVVLGVLFVLACPCQLTPRPGSVGLLSLGARQRLPLYALKRVRAQFALTSKARNTSNFLY